MASVHIEITQDDLDEHGAKAIAAAIRKACPVFRGITPRGVALSVDGDVVDVPLPDAVAHAQHLLNQGRHVEPFEFELDVPDEHMAPPKLEPKPKAPPVSLAPPAPAAPGKP